MKITHAIAAEHATLLKWFDELEAVLPRLRSRADVGALALLVGAVLGNHRDSENEFAFSPLDRVFRQTGYFAKHSQEHHELGRQLGKVRRAASFAEACRRLRAALQASRKHFVEEEQSLFPVLEKALTPEALSRLGQRFHMTRQSKTRLTDRPGPERPARRASADAPAAVARSEPATRGVAAEPGALAFSSADDRLKHMPAATPSALSRKELFRIMAPEARRVLLVGDFTKWHQRSIPLKRTGKGVWSTTVRLTAGRHAYRFLVDGKWHDDPGCNFRIPNAFQDHDLVRAAA
jgi:hypothetical protein